MVVRVRTPGGVEELPIEEFERRVREGELDPETLVNLESVTGNRFAPLRSLELYVALAKPDEQAWRERLRTAAPVVTAALIGLQVRVYLWTKVPGTLDRAVDAMTNWAPAVTELGQVYRVLSYGFLHLSFSHLALNLTFLAYAGANLERALGRRNMLTLFLVSVVTGGVISLAFSGNRPSLGSSGGDFGLLAAALVFGVRHAALLPVQERNKFGWALMPYILYPLAVGLLSSAVDNGGHFGGLIAGGVLASLLEPDHFPRAQLANRAVRRGALALCALTVGLVWALGPWAVALEPISVGGLALRCPARWAPAWTFTDDWGRVSPTQLAAFAATRRTYESPLAAEEAVLALVEQLDDRAEQLALLGSTPRLIDGYAAISARLSFSIDGAPQVLYALVLPRGAHVYRVTLQCRAAEAARCGSLAERIFATTHLDEPPELTEAREAHARAPDDWQKNLALGIAAGNAGLAEQADEALERAYELAGPNAAEVAVAQLALYADYPQKARLSQVKRLLAEHPDDAEVALAAYQALHRLRAFAEAEALLRAAAERWPDDPGVRRALAGAP